MAELGEPLSKRELDVLNCIADGATNKEAAGRLVISPNTVKVHVRNIYIKLGVSSRTEAVTAALQKGIVTMPGMEPTPPEPEPEPEPAPPQPEPEPALPQPEPEPEPEPSVEIVAQLDTKPKPGENVAESPTEPASRWRLWGLVGGAVGLVVLVVVLVSVFAPAGEDTPAQDEFTELPIGESNWLTSRTMPDARARMAVANVGLNLYQIGGETADGIVNNVDIYVTNEFNWFSGAPKLTAVADATAAVLSGEIYVPGGRLENGQATTSVEAYSPLNDGWRPVAPLPRPVAGGLTLSDEQHLYLIGGQEGDSYLTDVYRYGLDTQAWESVAPLPTARAFAAGGVSRGQLFVVGGENESGALADCWVFDPAGDAWSSCPSMSTPRSGAGATALAGRLYVMGGDSAGTGEFYTINDDVWVSIELPMFEAPSPWTHLGVVGIETRVYTLGGLLNATPSDATYAYSTLSYQYYIPAAPIGGE